MPRSELKIIPLGFSLCCRNSERLDDQHLSFQEYFSKVDVTKERTMVKFVFVFVFLTLVLIFST